MSNTPTVEITEPANGARIKKGEPGIADDGVHIAADACDPEHGIKKVSFSVCKVGTSEWHSKGEDTTPPYTCDWDTDYSDTGNWYIRATAVNGTDRAASDTITITLFDVRIAQPAANRIFAIAYETMQIPSPGIVCEVKCLAGTEDITSQIALTLNWQLTLRWTGGGSTYHTDYSGAGNPHSVPAQVFGVGGDFAVFEVTGTANGRAYERSVTGVRIRVNQDPGNLHFWLQMGADIIRAIAWQEWAGWPDRPRWNHYTPESGNVSPYVNATNDWGVMQINKYYWEGYFGHRWDQTAWNWRINITDGAYIHQIYMHERQTAEQQTWPETAADAATPNREDLATYGYHRGEGPMREVTRSNWASTVLVDTYTQNVRRYRWTRPWE